MRYCDDIGMYAIDRSRESCAHRTAYCNKHCYNNKLYKVYKEMKGELLAYAPFEEWENCIDRLFKVAKQRSSWKKEEDFQEDVVAAEREKENWWRTLRRRWGI